MLNRDCTIHRKRVVLELIKPDFNLAV